MGKKVLPPPCFFFSQFTQKGGFSTAFQSQRLKGNKNKNPHKTRWYSEFEMEMHRGFPQFFQLHFAGFEGPGFGWWSCCTLDTSKRHGSVLWVSLNKNDMMTWCFPTTDVFSTEVPGNFIVNIFSPTDQPGAKPPVPPEADPLFFFWVEWKMSGFPWHSFPIFVTIELYRWNHLAISGKIGQTSTSFTFFSLEKKHSFSQFSAWNYRHVTYPWNIKCLVVFTVIYDKMSNCLPFLP